MTATLYAPARSDLGAALRDEVASMSEAELEALCAGMSQEELAVVEDALALLALEADHDLWLPGIFPDYVTEPFGEHHDLFWNWLWSIVPGRRPAPFVGIWPRGGAKSTSAEMGTVALGCRRRRRYGLYICETQDQADDHVATIGAMLELATVAHLYPAMASRDVNKYGSSRGWRRNRLRTASGFTLDALGLDKRARGVKFEDQRPDFLVLDDIDSEDDTVEATSKKVRTLTRKILPAGAPDVAVLAIQNLVIRNGVFGQLAGVADQRADFLLNRIVSGPIPALRDFTWVERDGRFLVSTGSPTWAGQSRAVCQANIDEWGITSFRSEAQHDTEAPPGGMYDHIRWRRCKPEDVPELVRVVCWVDPAVSDTDQSDSMGIQVDALGVDDVLYRLRSWEQRSSPLKALCKAIRWAIELGAEHVGVETDQGGDTWRSVYKEACKLIREGRDGALFSGEDVDPDADDLPVDPDAAYDGPLPRFRHEKAGSVGSKTHRSQQMLADYERPGRIVHVEGYHLVLESALRRFPKTKPLDLADAAYWSWRELRPKAKATGVAPEVVPGENYWDKGGGGTDVGGWDFGISGGDGGNFGIELGR